MGSDQKNHAGDQVDSVDLDSVDRVDFDDAVVSAVSGGSVEPDAGATGVTEAALAEDETRSSSIGSESEAEAPAPPPSELELLQGQLEAERGRSDELLRQVADARNEMEAVQRRSEQQLERSRRHQMADFLRDLLPILDEFQQALAVLDADGARATEDGNGATGHDHEHDSIQPQATDAALAEGVRLTQHNLLELLRRHGLEELTPQGEVFDPLFHEAISSVEAAPTVAANTVVQVVQRGYTLHDRLLRAARVMVAAQPSAASDTVADASDRNTQEGDERAS